MNRANKMLPLLLPLLLLFRVRDLETFVLRLSSQKSRMIERSIVAVFELRLSNAFLFRFVFLFFFMKKEISFIYYFHIITVHEMSLLNFMREVNCKFAKLGYVYENNNRNQRI